MDGVISDFVGGVEKILGLESGYISALATMKPGVYNISELLGMDDRKIVEAIRSSPDFWESLEKYKWTDAVLGILNETGINTFIATMPLDGDPLCVPSKICWINAHVDTAINTSGNIFISKKYLLSKPGAILIDDNEIACMEFAAMGGSSILFPQAWNSMWWVTDPISYLEKTLALAIEAGKEKVSATRKTDAKHDSLLSPYLVIR